MTKKNIRRLGRMQEMQDGFTLLELLISITLICLILLIAGSAVRLGMRSVSSGERRMDAMKRFSSSLNIVDAQIQSQIPVAPPDISDTNPVFQGDSESMQFMSNFSIWGRPRGYVAVSYKVVQDQYGKQELHVEESATGSAPRGEVKLFNYFDRIYFDYYYKEPASEEGSWIDKWEDAKSVPDRIRLHLVSGESEISLIIPVKVRDLKLVTNAPTS